MLDQRSQPTTQSPGGERVGLVDMSAADRPERRRVQELMAPSGEPLNVAHARERAAEIIACDGEIDVSTEARLVESLVPTLQRCSGAVVIDLWDVTFMDSTGVRVLLSTHKQLEAQQRQLAIVCQDGGAVHRVLEVTGVLDIISVHGSRESALTGGCDRLK